MGWDNYHRPAGETDRDHLQREVCGTRYTIIDSATKGFTFYGAVRDDETGEVWALIVLQRRTRGHYNYSRKVMDETVGPFYYDCPTRILDILTPTDNERANEWRAKCRETIAARAARPKVGAGTVIRFPFAYTVGSVKVDTFTYTGKGSLFTAEGVDGRVRITGWRNRPYEVVTPATV
jgi:hypothetical protein